VSHGVLLVEFASLKFVVLTAAKGWTGYDVFASCRNQGMTAPQAFQTAVRRDVAT
jgi:hypothetical protein